MLGEDLSGRFDYLFEPLEVDESAGDGDEVAPRELEQPDDENRWSRRLVFTGVLLATMAAAVATAIVLLPPAQRAEPIVTPSDSTAPSTTMTTAMPTTTVQPVPVSPATVSPPAIQTPAPNVAPQPQPVQLPTTLASEPPAPMPPPPTTRAPMSVSPESRAPFPNQEPPGNNDQRGGLL